MITRENMDKLNNQVDQVRKRIDASMDSLRRMESISRIHADSIGAYRETGFDIANSLMDNQRQLMNSDRNLVEDLVEYITDMSQRAVMTMDILRKRGNQYFEHTEAGCPPVLHFDYETLLDGRDRSRPVNYALVRIVPPKGVTIDRLKRPYVIIDPRAGHGAGIGGFKPDSQVGEAFKAGHAVYFVIFFPHPEEGQTLADVCNAEAEFVDEVRRLHPEAPNPAIIGNCQGGWASMLLAASHPDTTGPVVVNGAPLSYWAGENGKNPMRYLGGMLGGVTPALLASDLGNGKFDGAHLVYNFEQLNPANTYWKKLYNLYSKADTEEARFLEFERWWSGYFFMNEEEIRWIVENLFVGNKLANGEASFGDGKSINLRNIKSPIVVFASQGDNITPPQQALNWIIDAYRTTEELRAHGQRIVYLMHDTIGHLGIFVSASVAKKEHHVIVDVLDEIENLAPGLYEMVLETQVGEEGEKSYTASFINREIEDILAMDDGSEDEEFAEVNKMSELMEASYENVVRPVVRNVMNNKLSEMLVQMHPLRLERAVLSDRNPGMVAIKAAAEEAIKNRKPVSNGNPFLMMEKVNAQLIEQSLNLYRDMRDASFELMFHGIYSNPMAMLMNAGNHDQANHVQDQMHDIESMRLRARQNLEIGGLAEGVVRALLLLAKASGSVHQSRLARSTVLLHHAAPFAKMSDQERSAMIRQQSSIVELLPDEALANLPKLLGNVTGRKECLAMLEEVVGDPGELSDQARKMWDNIHVMLAPKSRRDIVAKEAEEA